jgi:hypothetical protein
MFLSQLRKTGVENMFEIRLQFAMRFPISLRIRLPKSLPTGRTRRFFFLEKKRHATDGRRRRAAAMARAYNMR